MTEQRKEIIDPETFDRCDFLPCHEGPNVLPHDLLFHSLYDLALRQNTIIIKDKNTGLCASHQQFIGDILALRSKLRAELDPSTLTDLQHEREICLLICAEGYEFAVSFFAVQALGGIAVPCSPHITLKEVNHNADTVRAKAIITSIKSLQLAQDLEEQFKSRTKSFKVVCSTPVLISPLLDLSSVTINSGRTPDQNKPALVIFTSGSTGPPKGVAIRRYNLYALARYFVNNLKINQETTIVQFLPTHHATGLLFNTLPALIGGGCVEFSQGGFDAAKVWERFREGGLPSFSALPTVYVRLLRYWETVLSKLPQGQSESYRVAVSTIGSFHSSTSALSREVGVRWRELTGKAITERYGGSEVGGVYSNVVGELVVPGSVGKKIRMTESKLSGGDHGEILARSPFVFMKYMYDPEATRRAFDQDGFYLTGDIARQEGDLYFIEGRSAVDIIKSGGYKISALDIEEEIRSHPQVSEVAVVGVDDDEFGQRIAAAVVLHASAENLTLTELRKWLGTRLSNYKLPTMLRVVPELPKTPTFKVRKLLIKKDLFEIAHPDIQMWSGSKRKAARL
ncbi:hypothetical protein LTR84_012785 [Exophiala bonariae]|uniref:AMP-dependent synthetase/ligase domain-containing protein n=1 Tax=Exophiala bonariae TaxID=1690606 RepID=A0AAV9NIQ0_9EURO|nr:hypothetical protein LTR84_012785 [Exophiala bonariae]